MIFFYLLMILFSVVFFSKNMNLVYYFLESSKFLFFNFMMDFWSKMFLLAVLTVTFMIFIYSKYYMSSESFMSRFLFLVFWFVLSMMMLLTSGNFFTLFIGWDGLGVSSYFLVVFYQNWKSMNAGMITILSNRVGDCFYMVFFILLIVNFDKFNDFSFLSKIMMFIFLVICLTKSAQFPFSAWLPAAMAAPTPVSSLVHSSTLVTAGFYLMFRFSMFNSMVILNTFIILFSFLTLFYSGMNGLLEMDFKKIIALSTLSQLSLMFISISIEMKIMSFFHLFTHAFFKSLLFISVGAIIHFFFNNQDMRNYNLLFMNMLKLSIFLSMLSLMGLFFSSGFFSKDFILEKIFMKSSSLTLLWMFFLMMFLTMFYSLRLVYSVFFLKINQKIFFYSFSNFMMLSMFFLSILSLIIGNLLLWNFLNLFFLFSFLKMKMFMFLLFLTSVVLFFVFYFKDMYLYYFFSSMLFLTKMSIFFNKIFFIMKKPLLNFFEKSFIEIYESNMTYKFFNIFSLSFMKIKFIFMMMFFLLMLFVMIY